MYKRNFFSKISFGVDWLLVFFIVPLTLAGLITMKSFSPTEGAGDFFSKQIIWLLISFAVFFVFSFIDFRFLKRTDVLVSILMIVFGLFMSGAIYDNNAWVERVDEMKAKVAEAEAKGKEETVRVETKVVTKTQVIKQKAQVVKQYIDREITKYDNTCVIPKEFVKAHNDAAEVPAK